MQDSIQLDQSDNEQETRHNQFQFSSVISPKGRRLTKGLNNNTASHQSLAYSNSTYNKNQFTERSPPLFSIDNISNNQNINTLNFSLRPFDRKESTFGSGKGLAIEFDRIKEESYLDDEERRLDETLSREKIDFPCFLSNENSPNNKFNFNNQNDSLSKYQQDNSDSSEKKPKQSSKFYTKITPSSRQQIKQSIVKGIKQKVEQKTTKSTKKQTKPSKQSHQKSTNSLLSIEDKRSRSPLQTLNKSPYSHYKSGDEVSALKQKIKELEYSLQVESISTEELRTKVSVLNELLEEKFLERNGINFKLFKNSAPLSGQNAKSAKNFKQKTNSSIQKESKTYSNIDLYVEMKVMEKAKQEIQIQYERVNHELAQKTALLGEYEKKCDELDRKLLASQKVKNQIKTQTSFNSNSQQYSSKPFSKSNPSSSSSNDYLMQRISELEQQNEALVSQIQHQKSQLSQKDQKIASLTNRLNEQEKKLNETESYVKLFQEKQKRFTEIQRPKFISQIKDLTERLDSQREQIERLEMENNLIQMQLEQGNFRDSKLIQLDHSPQGKLSTLKKSKLMMNSQIQAHELSEPRSQASQQMSLNAVLGQQPFQQNNHKNAIPDIPDAMSLIMHQQQELKLLKKQRDHFREQFESIKKLEEQNYRLRLKNQDLENELHSIRQLIEVDDEVTF